MHDSEVNEVRDAHAMIVSRRLPDGRITGVVCYLFTHGLVVDATADSYAERYCYPNVSTAVMAWAEWDGTGDPPGPWIKHKGRGVDRTNPNAKPPEPTLLGIPVVIDEHAREPELRGIPIVNE